MKGCDHGACVTAMGAGFDFLGCARMQMGVGPMNNANFLTFVM
jgi:hypothetical protein